MQNLREILSLRERERPWCSELKEEEEEAEEGEGDEVLMDISAMGR